ncbi:hypothetical protein F0562_011552 [Nyssa sinensis]|uniref:Uncharacterized protein n=1 Tax=Nyssa sinensis TaxID=561372 RepID=A0A5J4ZS66_9ASTE|nr:hypothetical protein F0562_011552 [Nyssa sinensis]
MVPVLRAFIALQHLSHVGLLVQGGEPLDFITKIITDDRNVKLPAFGGGECMFFKKNPSTDANNIGVDVEGVGVDVVDIEKVGVDVVGVEKVGGNDVGVENDGVDVEKPDQVKELCLRKTRVYNRRPLTIFESLSGSQTGVGNEGLKAPEIIPNVKYINTLQNTDGSVKTKGIAQNDGTMKPSEAIPSTGATGLAGVAIGVETLPICGGMSIPSVPIDSHHPISRKYNRVLWFRDMVGEQYVPFFNLVKDRYPQTFENFKCKLFKLRYMMLDILGRTIKQLNERAILSFQINEIHELLCAIADFKLNGLQVE